MLIIPLSDPAKYYGISCKGLHQPTNHDCPELELCVGAALYPDADWFNNTIDSNQNYIDNHVK